MRSFARLFSGLLAVILLVAGSRSSLASDGPAKADPNDAALISRGKVVYAEQCASCHGADAQGAPNWQERDEHGELPAPPHDAEGHTWRHSDAELYEMVSTGWRDLFNKTRRLTMPNIAEEPPIGAHLPARSPVHEPRLAHELRRLLQEIETAR